MASLEEEEEWTALVGAARVTTGEDDFLKQLGGQWDGTRWHTYLPERVHVRFDKGANEHLDRLLSAWPTGEDSGSIRDRFGDGPVLEAVVRHASQVAADAQLHGTVTPRWSQIISEISRTLSVAVVVVPIGGVFSSAVDESGDAAPVLIGERAVVGHLDESFEEETQRLARRVGLPGFRFSDESWWTEDFVAAQRDPHVGAQTMEHHDEHGTWPWLVAAWAVPAAGVIAEHAAITASEALLGALVLLSHSPGTHWGRFHPWIPGCPSRAGDPSTPSVIDTDNTIDTAPQRVDAMLEHLHQAVTSGRTLPNEVDVGTHATGPASSLLAAVADSAAEPMQTEAGKKLASACRLALYAAAATPSDVRISLATEAADLLLKATAGQVGSYSDLSDAGFRWRTDNNEGWPTCYLIATPQTFDPDHWRENVPASLPAKHGTGLMPSWAAKPVKEAELALNAVQITLFGVAALLSDSSTTRDRAGQGR